MSIINNLDSSIRADVLLANANPKYSRAALAKLFTIKKVLKESRPIKAGEKIQSGESIIADITVLEKPAEPIDLPVIYEDDNVIVVDKPVGVISHARGRYWDEPSVASFVRGRLSGLTGERAGIVHRLDRATSGVMICAKNAQTLKYLQRQFSNRRTKKVYFAIIEGVIQPDSAIIDISVGRNPKKPQTFQPDSNGKTAQTLYETVKTTGKYTLLKLTPHTGRTHQLRVHLRQLNRPIVGDDLYGGAKAIRLYLHATELEINLPGNITKTFTSSLPISFEQKLS